MNPLSSFIKFPSTPHLAVLDKAVVREEKVFSPGERDQFLSHVLIVEEKIDGANLGISFGDDGSLKLQNRGSLLAKPLTGQWKALSDWVAPLTDRLFDSLTNRYTLFGEWCYATHSIYYDRLPDWFVGFDIFDSAEHVFFNKTRRDELLSTIGIHTVPCLTTGRFALNEVVELLGKSQFADVLAEGLYLRYDNGDVLGQRAKLVRPDFIQSIQEHWSRGPLKKNQLARYQSNDDA